MDSCNIKDLQKVCLEIFKEFQKVCKKYGFRYYLDGGTMLGAIRHQGFIPWDDDLDVAMFREDYDKFLEVAQKELGEKYFLQNFNTDKNFPLAFSKIRKSGTYIEEPQYLDIDMDKGIFIDIFPVDKKPGNGFIKNCERVLLRFIYLFYCASNKKLLLANNKDYENIILFVRKFVFWKNRPILKYFSKRLQRYNFLKKPKFYASMSVLQKDTVTYKAEWFNKFELKKFADTEAYVPVGYNELLTHTYGDYMKFPPVEDQRPKHSVKFSIDKN